MKQPPMPPSLTGETGPAIVVRVGPAGADVAKLHLHHGGSPDTLIEAAALSLAQTAMQHGTLDPAAYATWVQQRLQFLAHIPNAAALFGTVEAAQHTVEAVTARRPDAVSAKRRSQGPSAPPSPAAVQPNALLPVARLGSPHSSLYSR